MKLRKRHYILTKQNKSSGSAYGTILCLIQSTNETSLEQARTLLLAKLVTKRVKTKLRFSSLSCKQRPTLYDKRHTLYEAVKH